MTPLPSHAGRRASSLERDTETHYQLIISHGTEVTVANVWIWQYFQYSNGDRVQISYWKGGLVGVKWFIGVGDPKQDW